MQKKPKFVTREGRRLYSNVDFCRDYDKRIETVSELESQIPASIADIKKLLRSAPHGRWSREAHFTIFCFLPWELTPELGPDMVSELETYLMTVNTTAAQAAWICGETLAHWATVYRSAPADALRRCFVDAPFVAGRLGALHGLQHRLNHCSITEGRQIVQLIANSMESDASLRVRNMTTHTLAVGHCWNQKGAPKELVKYAHQFLGPRHLYDPRLLRRCEPAKTGTKKSRPLI
ncbi:MAG: hypothetical protein ACE14M_11435 [Terriglobales bacterium]